MIKNDEQLAIATIRSLCIDMINKANSGHPGMALGSAPMMYTLWTKHLNINPDVPNWFNRDRFILSAGHASSLLYAMLHLSGFDLSIDDLKQFRQLNSLTPGHPEYRHTVGVDATSGPLGQGIAQAVGMAMAETMVQANYPDGDLLCNHYTYVLCGDGCLQEGISQEAISLAGHQKLNKLILLYDSNSVTLDGSIDLSFSESIKGRFLSSNWNVLEVKDGNDIESIDQAIKKAKKSKDKPTIIIVRTIIGYGSSKAGTSKAHGSPLGEEDGRKTKVESYHFDYPDFTIPNEIYQLFKQNVANRGQKEYQKWQDNLEKYAKKHEVEFSRFNALIDNDVSTYIPTVFPNFDENGSFSTRVSSGKALNHLMLNIPNLVGGSADVASSVMTKLDGGINYSPKSRNGHNINWGIREFAMASAQNGILLHGGVRTYVGCFLVFSDYMKPAIRMAALSKLPAIYLFSHDSIAVGEDGPTHQPIEQLAMLRSIPNINVIRPCDEKETYAAWFEALKSTETPTAIILSRQNLPVLANSSHEGLKNGGYVISYEKNQPQFVFVATGSEVSLAISAQKVLWERNIDTRVVSMPSWELFEKQDSQYKNSVLILGKDKTISIEMLSCFGWDKYADYHISINTFGVSAKAKDALNHFGFTVENVVEFVEKMISNS